MAVIARRTQRARQRGFTLTELLAVVAIMGILATIAISQFVGHARASKIGEAMAVVQAIRGAQERYRAENQVYLADDSTDGDSGWYPTIGVGDTRASFVAPDHDDYDAVWKQLKPTVDRPVGFGYRVNTGLPGDALPVVAITNFAASTLMTEPWYVVQAQADADGDGDFCRAAATSMNPEVIVENDGE